MYLTRLVLNPRNRQVQREVAQPYEMHRSMMRAFPDDLEEGQERVLFRLETAGRLVLLVQSWTPPDWSCLASPAHRGYLLPVSEPNPALKAFDLALQAGQALAFRLRANPTVKRKFPEGDHKRVGIYRPEEQMEWLRRKGERGGFAVLSANTSGRVTVKGWVGGNGKRRPLTMVSVQFDGILQVTDPDRLWMRVRQGIGSGKGLGFGLLSLAPAGL